jgi:NH3-dependent NAD+ synthetase
MGVTYEQLDNFFKDNHTNLSQETIARIQRLHQSTEHKRNKIKTPKKME